MKSIQLNCIDRCPNTLAAKETKSLMTICFKTLYRSKFRTYYLFQLLLNLHPSYLLYRYQNFKIYKFCIFFLSTQTERSNLNVWSVWTLNIYWYSELNLKCINVMPEQKYVFVVQYNTRNSQSLFVRPPIDLSWRAEILAHG
jgi:hypothetical protein